MKSFLSNLFILFAVALTLSLSGTSYSSAGTKVCTSILKGWHHVTAGLPYWETYKCSGSGCGIETSAMPDADGVTRCEGCGKPHSREAFIPVTTELRGGELYVLNSGGIGKTKLAESGLKWSCPECEATNFRVQPTCKNCSAPQPKNIENFLVDADGNFVNRGRTNGSQSTESGLTGLEDHATVMVSDDATSDIGDLTSTTSSAPLLEDSWNKNETTPPISKPKVSLTSNDYGLDRDRYETSQKPWRAWLTRGGTAVLAITAGTLIWGVQTFSEPGHVTSVDNTQIVVQYEHSGDSYTTVLNPEGVNSGVRWHKGEPVTLHFANFYWVKNHTPNGAERSNSEVYAPVLLERESK